MRGQDSRIEDFKRLVFTGYGGCLGAARSFRFGVSVGVQDLGAREGSFSFSGLGPGALQLY